MDIDINLLSQISRLQRLYLDYLSKADQARMLKGKPSEMECSFLQAAADKKSSLIQLTQGKNMEVVSHINDLEVLNKRISDIRDELEPNRKKNDLYSDNNNSSHNSSSASGNKAGAIPDKDKKVDDEEEDDGIDTSEWKGEKPTIGLDKVSGMESVKEKLKNCMVESELQRLAERLKLQVLNSFFFVGPPGCGKTFIIKAFVHDLIEKKNYNYLALDCSQIITKYVGDSEKIVKKIFEEAVNLSPCILFIDEIDGMCKNRSNPSLPEYASSLTTAFLTSYNIIKQAEKEIIFIGATNYPRNVDEAMMDRVEVVYVGLPDETAREKAFKMAFGIDDNKNDKDIPLIYFEPGLDAKYMAKCTKSYNYRDIERLIENIKKYVFNDLSKRLSKRSGNVNIDKYVDRTIDELDSGDYVLTKEVFDFVLSSFSPSNKTHIIRDIKEWLDEMRSDDDNSGISTFPNLEGHPDLENMEAEISSTVNGTATLSLNKDEEELTEVEEDSEPESAT